MSELEQQGIYADQRRPEVRPYIPRDLRAGGDPSIRRALDVGCGKGGFGLDLREALGPAARIVGVEAVAEQAAIAAVDHGFDEVVQGYFPEAIAGRAERFDLVSFNDVLEHLYDPWAALEAVHEVLADGGRVLATVPNVQFAPVVWSLLRGRWDYQDYGVLDRTHVRFFTRATLRELFLTCGFRVESCVGVNNVADQLGWGRRRTRLRHALGTAQWMQFVVVASVAPSRRR